jgi:hypothetical protein
VIAVEIELKNYSNPSNARRAAKAAKLVDFTIYKEGNWHKIRVAAETVAAPAPAPEKAATSLARTPKAPMAAKAPKAPKAPKAAKAKTAPKAKREAKAPAKKAAARKATAPSEKPGTKGAQLIDMISRGATITELMETLGWLPHTVRAALSRLGTAGYAVTRTKVGNADDGFESHYKIAS